MSYKKIKLEFTMTPEEIAESVICVVDTDIHDMFAGMYPIKEDAYSNFQIKKHLVRQQIVDQLKKKDIKIIVEV